jgi:hypothetical protein
MGLFLGLWWAAIVNGEESISLKTFLMQIENLAEKFLTIIANPKRAFNGSKT